MLLDGGKPTGCWLDCRRLFSLLPQTRAEGTDKFILPTEHLRAPAAWIQPKSQGAEVARTSRRSRRSVAQL